ncbi:hypothetical protein SAMN06297144_0078 [Sphingomonas guangdongensis]|uniref:Membrane domain of glycerophosphoryl diester phosphodiesterase n=1 Tax=Sphingomonas guangdongensis TaxID=1141890 RepID=A0A285QET5_9SPHN|nr:hypothetical protein [Sphingomonas guangdongensis]SOB78572.1 hypothetical protein SAMN06297144_0078 [Sphingomonas guangdongensis]
MVKMGYVWDRTTEFLGEHGGTILPLALLAIFVPSLISAVVTPLQEEATGVNQLLYALISLGAAVLSLWGQLAVTAVAIDPAAARAAPRVASARLLPAIGVYLIVMLIALAGLLPIVALVGAANIDVVAMRAGQMPTITPATGGAIALYALVYLVALLFLVARLLPVSAVIVSERRGIGAIGTAFRLTRGLTWRLFGTLLLYGVVTLVVTMAVTGVFGGLLGVFLGNTGPLGVTSLVTAVASAVVSTALTVVALVFAAKLYVALQRGRGEPELPLP